MIHVVGETSSNPVHHLFPMQHLGELTGALYGAVAQSFMEFPVNGDPTKAEIKHRFDIGMKWAKIMKGDLAWSYPRIYGHLFDALKAELSGSKYEPPTRTFWVAGD